ncbi:MAG: hypothetical protein QME70_13280 [Bacillota bacterium]|nr:hypothetical protein [Bacillota bacterium]
MGRIEFDCEEGEICILIDGEKLEPTRASGSAWSFTKDERRGAGATGTPALRCGYHHDAQTHFPAASRAPLPTNSSCPTWPSTDE